MLLGSFLEKFVTILIPKIYNQTQRLKNNWHRCTVEEICEFLSADSLAFLSVDGLVDSINLPFAEEKLTQKEPSLRHLFQQVT